MKASSVLIIVVVVGVFVAIQGWLFREKLELRRVVKAKEAVITGTLLEIRAPAAGSIDTVEVSDGQRVQKDQPLFTMLLSKADDPTAAVRQVIVAQRGGIISGIHALQGAYTCCGEVLMTIVDMSPSSLRVQARLPIAPERLRHVRPGLPATMQAPYLHDGKPLRLTLERVDSLYEADDSTIGVTFQLTRVPEEILTLPSGVPVAVQMTVGEPGGFESILGRTEGLFERITKTTYHLFASLGSR